jgi:hypothetical protein
MSPDAPAPADPRAARVAAFAALAVLSSTQDLVRQALPALTDADGHPAADPEVVAEETLALVATLSARAVEVGLREASALAEAAGRAVLEAPYLYHDFLLGAELVARGEEGEVSVDQSIYDRLARKAEFYGAHFPVGRFPGPAALRDKLPLWMGRISPPQLPTTPDARLAETGAADLLAVHLRLLLAFAQRESRAEG